MIPIIPASRPFSRGNKNSCVCACACVVIEDQALRRQLMGPGRSLHFNATYRNMLRVFDHPVMMCSGVSGVFGSNLKIGQTFHATFVGVA